MDSHIHPLIIKRRSIFSFSEKPIEQEELDLLFEAAGKAPSSFNAQPWGFIYAHRNTAEYSVMAGLLSDGNRSWASSAPVLFLSMAEIYSEEKKRANAYAFHDLGMATGNLLLQATYMELYIHPMGGYDKDRARKDLNIPGHFEPAAMMALGYPGSEENLPDNLKERLLTAGKRKELQKFVWKGAWKDH